jgi:hypothetical protein
METKNKNIGFSIIQISTEKFADLPGAFNAFEQSQIQHELTFGLDKEGMRVHVQELARFHNIDNPNPFIIISVSCQFLINQEDWDKIKELETNRIILPRDFGVHLAMLVVGTLRGILHTKTENTIFNQFIFPPIDIMALVPSDVVFE